MSPAPGPRPGVPATRYVPRVFVRTTPGGQDPTQSAAWKKLRADFPALRMTWALPNAAAVKKLLDAASATTPGFVAPDLSLWRIVDARNDADFDDLATRLRAWSALDLVHVERIGPGPAILPQRHLNGSASRGIGARAVWASDDARGAGVGFADIEAGWQLENPFFAGLDAEFAGQGASSEFDDDRAHGTRVLGTVCARGPDLSGVAPKAGPVHLVSHREAESESSGCLSILRWLFARFSDAYQTTEYGNVPRAVVDACDVTQPGDVILIEVQIKSWEDRWGPVELNPLTREVVRTAVAAHRVIVEAGGNGGIDLDNYKDVDGTAPLVRTSPDADSGAILVASARAANGLRLDDSPRGARIDCYAWGESVETADSLSASGYTSNFDGTSAAAAMIAGAALAVQGLYKERHPGGAYLAPRDLRKLLTEPSVGTKAADLPANSASGAGTDPKIGVMPDLAAIAAWPGFP